MTSCGEKRSFGEREHLFSLAEMDSQTPFCDLHNLKPSEAIDACDRFINQEFMQRTETIRIIHGRGSGKLREMVHKFLSNHELVRDFRDSRNPSEMLGATIAILEKRD